MATINRFEDIIAWQVARELSNTIYRVSGEGKFRLDYALKDQIRRSGGSAMDNIAEGYGRGGDKEFRWFLWIAKASTTEVKSRLYRALDEGYISEKQFTELYAQSSHVDGMIFKLISYINRTLKQKPK